MLLEEDMLPVFGGAISANRLLKQQQQQHDGIMIGLQILFTVFKSLVKKLVIILMISMLLANFKTTFNKFSMTVAEIEVGLNQITNFKITTPSISTITTTNISQDINWPTNSPLIYENKNNNFLDEYLSENTIELDSSSFANSNNHNNRIQETISSSLATHQHVLCGTLSTNTTKILVKNSNYPDPNYSKTICETVIERSDPLIKKLSIKFKQLELYRPTYDGQCLQDRFAIYTDLNALLTPVICGNYTGNSISILFPINTSVIVSITTSDLDHDRYWLIEIDQEK